MLHSILYTYLLEDELAEAVDFIDNLILQASVDIAMSSQELPAYEDGSRPPMMTLVTHRSQVMGNISGYWVQKVLASCKLLK